MLRFRLFLVGMICSLCLCAQQGEILSDSGIDSLVAVEDSLAKVRADSILAEEARLKLIYDMQRADTFISFSNSVQSWLDKKFDVMYDIQQRRDVQSNANLFVALLLMLILLTYLKLAFTNDLEELWYSVSSANRAVQIFRTQTDTFTVSSFLLNANFVLSVALFIQLSLQRISPSLAVESRITTLYLIILFTSFLLLRTLLLRIIGFVFAVSDVTAMYEFHFVRIAQTLGLTLLPAVLFIYALNEKYFKVVFVTSCLLCCVAIALLVVRGLSTSAKLFINNAKYFFIYVCVGEITLAFFFTKLLTKIVS